MNRALIFNVDEKNDPLSMTEINNPIQSPDEIGNSGQF